MKTLPLRTHSTLDGHPELKQRRDTNQHKSLKLHLSWLTRVKFLSYTWSAAYLLEYTRLQITHSLRGMGSIQAGLPVVLYNGTLSVCKSNLVWYQAVYDKEFLSIKISRIFVDRRTTQICENNNGLFQCKLFASQKFCILVPVDRHQGADTCQRATGKC